MVGDEQQEIVSTVREIFPNLKQETLEHLFLQKPLSSSIPAGELRRTKLSSSTFEEFHLVAQCFRNWKEFTRQSRLRKQDASDYHRSVDLVRYSHLSSASSRSLSPLSHQSKQILQGILDSWRNTRLHRHRNPRAQPEDKDLPSQSISFSPLSQNMQSSTFSPQSPQRYFSPSSSVPSSLSSPPHLVIPPLPTLASPPQQNILSSPLFPRQLPPIFSSSPLSSHHLRSSPPSSSPLSSSHLTLTPAEGTLSSATPH